MLADAPAAHVSDSSQKAGDKSQNLDHLDGARNEALAAVGKVEPKTGAEVPKGFGQLTLTEESGHQDASKLIFKKDGLGGEICEGTTAQGTNYTSHARPDGQGGVTEVYTSSEPSQNYTAHFDKDGSLKVDWQNGKHLERSRDNNGTVHTTMTGPEANDNYTATQLNGETNVQYADGSSWHSKDGKDEFHAGSGITSMLDKAVFSLGLGSKTDKTFWELNNAFWMSKSQIAMDVMDGQHSN